MNGQLTKGKEMRHSLEMSDYLTEEEKTKMYKNAGYTKEEQELFNFVFDQDLTADRLGSKRMRKSIEQCKELKELNEEIHDRLKKAYKLYRKLGKASRKGYCTDFIWLSGGISLDCELFHDAVGTEGRMEELVYDIEHYGHITWVAEIDQKFKKKK